MVWYKLQDKLKTAIALSPQEKRLFCWAWVGLWVVKVLLWGGGFKRTQWVLQHLRFRGISSWDSEVTIRTTAAMVRTATQYGIMQSSCLVRSLVLWKLLQDQGINSQLRIGVRHHAGQFQAHAWVEYSGVPLNESPQVQKQFAALL